MLGECIELIECKFSKKEFILLMKCWPKQVFELGSIECMDIEFENYCGLEDETLHDEIIITLHKKLLDMTLLEKSALADVIEHVGSKGIVTVDGVDDWGEYVQLTLLD